MPRNFSEHTDLTKIIKSILDSYPLGNGILRELLQNSDDASATQQTFILDLRTHPSESVVDQDLSGSQGPALLAVNDTLFSDSDWTAISTLHGSSKTTDETKIGKFGIGARACYHITDNPHFLSGDKLVIFDPHQRFSGNQRGGVMINVPEEGHAYPDQFAAFDKSLSPNASGFYPGTVVRLPLRTAAQAATSTIKPTVVEPDIIHTLFHDFVERELSVVMLFLKHIRYICLKVIEPNGQERFIGSAEIPDLSIAETRVFSRNTGAREETFRCTIDVTTTVNNRRKTISQAWRICHAVRSTEETSRILSHELSYPVGSKLADDKLFSHVALAFPIGLESTMFNGRLFTLLPLPIHTGFPLHMHGILALTPDRQSLRNIEEIGTGTESRERLLVTWNRSIFDKFLPATWSTLLRVIMENDETDDIWTAWPASEHANTNGSSYWSQILPKLLIKVIELDLAIFPAISNVHLSTRPQHYVPLSSAIIASKEDDPTLLLAFAQIDLTIVQLPDHIRKSLPSSSQHLILHPDSPRLREALLSRMPKLEAADETVKGRILQYLVLAPGRVTNAVGLPLVPLIDGSWFSLSSRQPTPPVTPVLVSHEEERVFKGCDKYLVSLSKMSEPVARVFCSPEAAQTVNIARLDKTIVWRYLNEIFESLNQAEDEITGDDAAAKVQWLIRFWKWMSTWSDKGGLLECIIQFHLLPTAAGTLRKMDSRAILPIPDGHCTMKAWELLGVQFLHPDVVCYASVFQQYTVPDTDVQFLIRCISPQLISALDSDKPSARLIQKHLTWSLQSSKGNTVHLDDTNRWKFLTLPIFPTRVVAPHQADAILSRRAIGPASGTVIYTRVDNSCPIPVAPGTTFLDLTAASGILATLIDPVAMRKPLDELGVLEMSIKFLRVQPHQSLNVLLSRLIPRLSLLSQTAKNNLQHVPFVSVIGSSERMPPMQVIDPHSSLAPLYCGEPGKLPSGLCGEEVYLKYLSSHGFLLRDLTAEIAEERLLYLSKNWCTDHSEDSRIFVKAKHFLQLLDNVWSPTFDVSRGLSLTGKWLPIRQDVGFAAPTECRDADKAFLFDLILSPVDGRVENKALRASLGWDCVPTQILQAQFSSALTTDDKKRNQRLYALIREFSRRIETLSEGEIKYLKNTVAGHSWIPVQLRNQTVWQTIQTERALLKPLRRSNLEKSGRFVTVHRALLEAHNGQGTLFLQQMGCTESPSLRALLHELESIVSEPPTPGTVSEALDILREMVPMLPNCSAEDLNRVFVPGIDNILHPLKSMYYVDNVATDFRPETGFAAHEEMPHSLALALGLQFLSALELGDDDEDDDLQMGEDLANRVENILKEHDVQYAFNEFLANAVDAKAKSFSVLMDERTFESSKVLGPGLAHLQRRPSLFLYNDAKLSDNDFRGLRQIGQGGKRSNPDSIGRYGLGALSLFHFTDVVQVVSDDRILILDPSGTYLPPRKGRPRTSLIRRISDVFRNFPDQLSAFCSVQGFSKTDPSYSGTLFRLPLRDRNKSSILSSELLQVSDCLNLLNGPYFSLAKDAMFFTCLEQISAVHRSSMGHSASLWSVDASRSPSETFLWSVVASRSPSVAENFQHEVMFVEARQPDGTTSSQRWVVTQSNTRISTVPPEHARVLQDMGLHRSQVGLVARMALILEDLTPQKETSLGVRVQPPPTCYLFSSMRLPVLTSLSAHISAQFAISSDRRHIRFEPADPFGHRLPEAAYNKWILDCLVPPLYISSILRAATIYGTPRDPFPWWPLIHNADDTSTIFSISREIVQAFYAAVVKTLIPVCYTVTSKFIAPINAMFATVKTPSRVQEVLRRLGAQKFVQLSYPIQKLFLAAASSNDSRVQFFDPSSVRDALLLQAPMLHTLYKNERLDIEMIGSSLLFLLEGAVSVSDIPLIVLADDSLTCASATGATKYICNGQIPSLFDRSHFLHQKFSKETQNLLVQSPYVNFEHFDAGGVLSLIQKQIFPEPRCTHPVETEEWINSFWQDYNNLPGPPSLSSLASLPLIPIVGGEYVSLQYCLSRDEVMTETINRPALVTAMRRMDLVFCLVPAPLRSELCKSFNLQAYLKVIRFKASPFESLSPEERRAVEAWISSEVPFCRDADSRNIVQGLPIWEGRRNGRNVLLAAQELEMLPSGLSLDIFNRYLRSGIALANHSNELEMVLSWSRRKATATSQQLAEFLSFPAVLHPTEARNYYSLLTRFLRLGGTGNIPVPDGNLALRRIDELYDHSVELFSLALQSLQQTKFLHPAFRHLREQLLSKGLHSTIDWDAFLLCATTVHQELTARLLSEDEILPKAEAVYNFYNSRLPGIVMTDANRWLQLNGLSFIPRHERRSPLSTYDVEPYCGNLPRIVAPGKILQSRYEAVAWSQRALFRVEPTTDLLALNKALGVPTVAEVVEHLKVLALKVAPQHAGNRSLLHQLRSTYTWLQDNKEDARHYLLFYKTTDGLFLNVDDPETDVWEWQPAGKLIVNAQYDYPPNNFKARQFLQPYRSLSLAAGAKQIEDVDFDPGVEVDGLHNLRDTFNDMRRKGQLTDVLLMPAYIVEEENVDETALRAHSPFLAAAIPHAREALGGNWSESASDRLSFPGTYFGACAVLDFIYTGKIEQKPEESDQGHMSYLQDLLELLENADEWDIPGLKDEIGRLVDLWKLLSPDTYQCISENARDYRATSLEKYCREWARKNPDLLGIEGEESEDAM